jgi:DNA-binding transcriptional ArsR family regulator
MDDRSHMTRVFKALADETRLRLIAELAERGEVTCGEFAQLCACSNSTLTYHQRILCEAGLVTVRRSGQFRVLILQRDALEAVLPGFLQRLCSTAPLPV